LVKNLTDTKNTDESVERYRNWSRNNRYREKKIKRLLQIFILLTKPAELRILIMFRSRERKNITIVSIHWKKTD